LRRGCSFSNVPARRNRVTQNSIYGTLKGPGIDLWTQGQPTATPRITANDGLKDINQANAGMDYPVITSSSLSGGTLTVKGFVGNSPASSASFADATLEFFIADNTPADQNGEVIVGDGKSLPHGEGRTYIDSCTADGNGLFNCSFPNAGSLGLTDPQNITATATDQEGNTSEFSAVITDGTVLLVKRITAINNSTSSFSGDNLAVFTEDPTTTDDNNPKWQSGYLLGGINGGYAKPSDEVEYTIYFLSAGNGDATEVKLCDLIPTHQTFVPQGYNTLSQAMGGSIGSDRGIAVSYNGSYDSHTNGADGDLARFYPPGSSLPAFCGSVTNPTGAVVVNLGQGATSQGSTDLGGTIPGATTAGIPTTSFGFIRFKAKTN
jgi:uncharacterized repeat protein (TIGR01451 family)